MLDTYLDKLVGVCLCNGKESIYVPLNHISALDKQRINLQIPLDEFKEMFIKLINERQFKWIYHNAKFDLSVLRTFLGCKMPEPFWDTMLGA